MGAVAGADPREAAGLYDEWNEAHPGDRLPLFRPKKMLRYVMRKERVTQRELATALGTSRETVSRWMSGAACMGDRHVVMAAALLGVSPSFLLDMPTSPSLDVPTDFETVSGGGDLSKLRDAMEYEAVRWSKGQGIEEHGEHLTVTRRYELKRSARKTTLDAKETHLTRDEWMDPTDELMGMSPQEVYEHPHKRRDPETGMGEDVPSWKDAALRSLLTIQGDYRDLAGVSRAAFELVASTPGAPLLRDWMAVHMTGIVRSAAHRFGPKDPSAHDDGARWSGLMTR